METLNVEGAQHAFSRDFAKEPRTVLQKWFLSCLKNSPDRGLEPEVFEIIFETLQGFDKEESANRIQIRKHDASGIC
jgi:hypothetical protein